VTNTLMTPATDHTGQTRKPKIMGSGHADDFQSPPSALEPLYPFLPKDWHIWEPAAGKGNLVNAFRIRGYRCEGSDVLPEEGDRLQRDFLTWQPAHWLYEPDCIVTNPPFTLKDEFLARCYGLGKPFALLLPLTALEGQARQKLYRDNGLEIIFMPSRVKFTTPSGKVGGSWFATAWFTAGLNIGRQLTFIEPGKVAEQSPQVPLAFDGSAQSPSVSVGDVFVRSGLDYRVTRVDAGMEGEIVTVKAPSRRLFNLPAARLLSKYERKAVMVCSDLR
jgi:hypothetical protein